MAIGSVTSFPPTTQLLNPVLAATHTSKLPAAVTALPAVTAAPATLTIQPPSQYANPAPAVHAAAAAPTDSAAAAAAAAALDVATAYTTTVGGKQYTGSVTQSDGEYVASIPNLAGAEATGASLVAAENNLTLRIDALV